MPVRFAVATGNWSNTAIWDNGALPVAGDTVHPNGFTVTLDQDINVDGLNNNIPPVYLPAMPIPLMTGNTQPSGVAFAGQNSSTAYQAFDYNSSTAWASTNLTNCTVGYQFTSGKIIKRYYLARIGENQRPTSWTFEGSNDGITWSAPLDTVTANTGSTFYLSGILANTTSYTYYRINITAVSSGTVANVRTLEMTESVGTVYGSTTGGSFTVPSSLSGVRNIVQTGDGIKSNTGAQGVVNVNAISGATVNFNVASGGYIFNPNWITANTNSTKGVAINGNCTVNFNGNIFGQTTSGVYNDTAAGQIYINAAATVTINGNVYAPPGASGSFTYQIHLVISTSNAAILNINGDVISSNLSYFTYPIYLNSLATVNITGNLTSVVGYCLFSATSSIVNLVGTATGTNSNSTAAIYMITTNALINSLLTINGSIINKNNVNAVVASKIRFASTSNPYWVYQTNGASDITLAYGAATGSYPAEADVRFGTTYSASPTRTGTLRVPLPQYVSQGVLTDNTVGTAYLSATDVWNVLTSSITTAGSIGERLKNASTVQTNGDQLAAYIV